MEKSDDIKGPSVLGRAKDEVVAVTSTVHDALHSVKKETEKKTEKLKGGIKHLLHKGPQLYGKAREEIKEHLFMKNVEDSGATSSPVETSIPVQVLDTKKEGAVKTSIPVQVLDTKKEGAVETSIPVQVLDTKKEGAVKTSIPVQVLDTEKEGAVETSIPVHDTKKEGALDTKKEGENNFVAFFARIFEKFCEPFNKKKD